MKRVRDVLLLMALSANAFTPADLSSRSRLRRCGFENKPENMPTKYPSNTSLIYATRMNLEGRFERWRYLQNFLEGDIDDETANEILFEVLNTFLNRPRPKDSEIEEDGSPELTTALKSKLTTVLDLSQDGALLILGEESNDFLLELLEELLPDPRDEEDANKSAWDTIMDIHGHEMVKVNEMNPTPEWRRLCVVARLLVHFDFLTRGIE